MSEEINAKVLLVDDEEQFLKALSQRLEGRGMKIEAATSGEDALRQAKGKDFDAIVLDLVMPGLDGLDVLKQLRQENPDLQIIMLTGHATVEKSVEAIKEGAVELLEKPVNMDKLLKRIGEAQRQRVILVEKKAEARVKDILNSKGW